MLRLAEDESQWDKIMELPWKLRGVTIWHGGDNELIIAMGTEEDSVIKSTNPVMSTMALNLATKTWTFGKSLNLPRVGGCAWPSPGGWCILGGNSISYLNNFELDSKSLKIKDPEGLSRL